MSLFGQQLDDIMNQVRHIDRAVADRLQAQLIEQHNIFVELGEACGLGFSVDVRRLPEQPPQNDEVVNDDEREQAEAVPEGDEGSIVGDDPMDIDDLAAEQPVGGSMFSPGASNWADDDGEGSGGDSSGDSDSDDDSDDSDDSDDDGDESIETFAP
jgi:hypothetical protein